MIFALNYLNCSSTSTTTLVSMEHVYMLQNSFSDSHRFHFILFVNKICGVFWSPYYKVAADSVHIRITCLSQSAAVYDAVSDGDNWAIQTLSLTSMSQKLRGGLTRVLFRGMTKQTSWSLSTIAVTFCAQTTDVTWHRRLISMREWVSE